MKKLLFSVVFVFAANYFFAQSYFNTTTSNTNSNADITHYGSLVIGLTIQAM